MNKKMINFIKYLLIDIVFAGFVTYAIFGYLIRKVLEYGNPYGCTRSMAHFGCGSALGDVLSFGAVCVVVVVWLIWISIVTGIGRLGLGDKLSYGLPGLRKKKCEGKLDWMRVPRK